VLAILRQRNFALLWFGQLISVTGDLVLYIAVPFYIYELTGSALATGGMFLAFTVPPLVLGSVAGVFVDRWDRRQTMIVADAARAALLLALLLVRSREWVWIVYVVAALESSISQFFAPAKGALLPHLVEQKDLVAANSLMGTSDGFTRVVGPSLGGALMGLGGLTTVVLVDSVSYLVSGILILLIAARSGTPAARFQTALAWAGVWRDWLAGMRLVKAQRVLAGLLVVAALAALGQGIVNVLLVAFVKDILHGEARHYGWLATAQGTGALVGSLLVGRLAGRIGPRGLIAAGLTITGALFVAIIHFRSLAVALALLVAVGVVVMGSMVGTQTLLQSRAPDQFRGRVFGSYGTTSALALMVGMTLAGAAGDVVGAAAMLEVAGALFFAAGVVAAVMLREQPSAEVAEQGAGQ
jgi:MFS family permease